MIQRQWVDLVNKWRKTAVHHPTFSLIDDVKETWDNFDYKNIYAKSAQLGSLRESDDDQSIDKLDLAIDRTKEKSTDIMTDDLVEGEGKVVMEEWKCVSCGQIYASMWPKCPGCLRSNTHYVYFSNQD